MQLAALPWHKHVLKKTCRAPLVVAPISFHSGCLCLPQELVAHEAVVAETSRAQQKAKEAAAAVDAVSTAAQQLGAVDTTTNQTLGSLAAAAAALNTITAVKDSAPSSKGHGGVERQQHPRMWDLKGRIEQHKQKVRVEWDAVWPAVL